MTPEVTIFNRGQSRSHTPLYHFSTEQKSGISISLHINDFPLRITSLGTLEEPEYRVALKKLKKRGFTKVERDTYPLVMSDSLELLWVPNILVFHENLNKDENDEMILLYFNTL